MKFFSNKISVNGPSRSFSDIVNDVAGGMKKQASSSTIKEAKKGELPDFIKEKMEDDEPKSKGKKGKKGLPPEFLAQQKGKKASSSDSVKVAEVIKINNDEVLLVLAESDEDSTDAEMAVDIEDDSTDEAMLESMNMVANEAMGYGDNSEAAGCEACGTSMASSEGMENEAGWSDKQASSQPKFVKIANLTDKQKGKFRSYWSNVWPKDFIDAVLETEN